MSRDLPLVATVKMSAEERAQLHTDAKQLQQYLVTSRPRNQFGDEECSFMLLSLDICLNSCTSLQADNDLKEVVESLRRILG